MRSFFSTVLFLVLVTVAPCILAQEAPTASDIKKAAAAFDRGREAFRNDSYVEAAEHFEAAESYAPSAAALRLAIASRKAAGQLDRAATLAALAVEQYPEEEQLLADAQQVLGEADGQLGQVTVNCDEPCELLLDNKLVPGKRDTSRILYVQPGQHQVQANWPQDRVDSESVDASAGQSVSVDFYAPLPPEPDSPDSLTTSDGTPPPDSEPEDVDQGGWSPAVFWTGVGLTVAGGGATAALGIRALNEPGVDAVKECNPDVTDCQALLDEGKQNQMQTNIAAGATAAVGVFTLITGIWLTDWDGKKKDSASRGGPFDSLALERGSVTVRPLVTLGNGATIGAVGTF